MLNSTKVTILVGKKEKSWPGWDLNSRPPCRKSKGKVLTNTPWNLYDESVFFLVSYDKNDYFRAMKHF